MTAEDVDKAWEALLEETLPQDKREQLMETFKAEEDPKMRYNMLLEFSSYLRQGAEFAESRYRGGGGGSGGSGGRRSDGSMYSGGKMPYDEDDDGSLCWEIVRVLVIVSAVVG